MELFLQEEYVSIDLETLRDSDIFCKILPPKNEENDKILEEAGLILSFARICSFKNLLALKWAI